MSQFENHTLINQMSCLVCHERVKDHIIIHQKTQRNVSCMGLLDGQFHLIEALQRAYNPDFVVKIIVTFLDGTDRFLNHVDRLLNVEIVDFARLSPIVHHLKGSCLTFGALNMSFAAIPLVQFCDANDKDECMKALDTFKSEYLRMQNKLKALVQLEKQIQLSAEDEAQIPAPDEAEE